MTTLIRLARSLPRYTFLRLRGRCVACGTRVPQVNRSSEWATSLHCLPCLNGPLP